MASWAEITDAEPELMQAVAERFDAYRHKLLATVRADGSPRISGIEVDRRDGELWFAGMPEGRKFQDLRRDPRFALHSGSEDSGPADPAAWPGDAKLAGTTVEIVDPDLLAAYAEASPQPMPPGPFELFRADIHEVVLIHVGVPADHLIIKHWHEGRGLRTTKRY